MKKETKKIVAVATTMFVLSPGLVVNIPPVKEDGGRKWLLSGRNSVASSVVHAALGAVLTSVIYNKF